MTSAIPMTIEEMASYLDQVSEGEGLTLEECDEFAHRLLATVEARDKEVETLTKAMADGAQAHAHLEAELNRLTALVTKSDEQYDMALGTIDTMTNRAKAAEAEVERLNMSMRSWDAIGARAESNALRGALERFFGYTFMGTIGDNGTVNVPRWIFDELSKALGVSRTV